MREMRDVACRQTDDIPDAGEEFVRTGEVSEETIKKLEIPMLGHNTFAQAINLNWDEPGVGPYGKLIP